VRIAQQILFVETDRKRHLLASLLEDAAMARTLVFTRTKRGADRVAKYLEGAGIRADAIHGDKSQGQRERALAAFKSGALRALVATDIAARGIDVDGVTHVVNYDLPNVPEAYVHRIGRTARAGADGVALSLVADDERSLLKDIQKVTRQTIPAFDRRNDRALGAMAAVEPKTATPARPEQSRGGGRPQARGRPHQRSGKSGGNSGGKGGGGYAKPSSPAHRSIASTQPAARWSPVD
jgi:ATP-dependent RNA helicase RhlE